MNGGILALDLATTMGWAEGVPGTGDRPTCGTQRLAPSGSEPAAIFGGMIDFIARRMQAFQYRMVIYEAPFDPRVMGFKTNVNTARMLLGLPAIVEGVCYQMGMHNLREANVNDVRKFLLGVRPKKDEAKGAVIQRLRTLGHDPQDDNAADALALWLYAASIMDSRVGIKTTRLFSAP
jgi:hypothetical protein